MKKTVLFLFMVVTLSNAELMERGGGGDLSPSEGRMEIYKVLNKELHSQKQEDESVPKSTKTNLLPKGGLPKNTTEVLDTLEKADQAPDEQSIAELDGEENNPAKVKLRNYDIEYYPAFYRYSYLKPGLPAFKKWLKKNKVSRTAFKIQLGTASNLKAIVMSALYYDWVKQNPSIAENFYRMMFQRRSALNMEQKLYLADYLMRTNRGSKIHYLFKKSQCAASFKYRTACFYYLGMDNYIRTGNPKNKYFWIIKPESKKARRIMSGKEP